MKLRERNFEVLVVADADGAKAAVLALLPEGAERVLILERDFRPGRTTIILLRDPVGM
jgi:hypothetical protein